MHALHVPARPSVSLFGHNACSAVAVAVDGGCVVASRGACCTARTDVHAGAGSPAGRRVVELLPPRVPYVPRPSSRRAFILPIGKCTLLPDRSGSRPGPAWRRIRHLASGTVPRSTTMFRYTGRLVRRACSARPAAPADIYVRIVRTHETDGPGDPLEQSRAPTDDPRLKPLNQAVCARRRTQLCGCGRVGATCRLWRVCVYQVVAEGGASTIVQTLDDDHNPCRHATGPH
jgi:hypothetical protein